MRKPIDRRSRPKTPVRPEPDDKSERTSSVQSVDRALSVLEVLGEDEEGYRLTDLATRTGLSPSTIHRLLTALEQRRFVQFDQSDGMWHVGRRTFAVGSAFVRRRNFVAPALPILRRLRDQTRETANLAIIDEGEVVFLTQVESREIMRAITRSGGSVPMVTSGVGKVIMATYSDEDVAAIVQRYGMRRMTPKSLTRASELREVLRRIRRDGYGIDDEEYMMGLRCVSAPIYDAQGEALAAISISGLTSRMTDDRLERLGRLVRDAAHELTEALGGITPLFPGDEVSTAPSAFA
ncbi:IclR family transcriptional regulator [Methylobacterium radiodurans]|uniref:Transcriptional regulator n=1 Tax=Methylobacterium radiodurans TaxID=2202828 RepID=A0A2U8VNN5_9HYPH|nr:IclR family transcriptional regulator C-terminal domain-containing protein [Methylobacterium radiodurans]AWN35078.1 transcriptional regulator [Methylobacterium radiodurans]